MKIKVIKVKNKPSASDDKIKSPLTAFKNQEITQAKKNLKLVQKRISAQDQKSISIPQDEV